MRKQWLFIFIAVVGSAALSYGVGFALGIQRGAEFSKVTPIQITVNEGSGKPADLDLTPFWESYRVLKERYVDQSKLDLKKMLYGGVAGFVSSVGDPYTVFVPAEEQEKFVEDLQGSFGGIGAEIGIRKGVLVVISPLAESPAEKAGLKAGDRILKIDEAFTPDFTLDEAVSHIRGAVGSSVKLLILPEDAEEPREVSIIRQTIVVPSIKWEVKDGIGIVRILNFNADASRSFAELVRDIKKLPQNKLVIDVRNNPGGFLDVAQDIASWFLARGEVVVFEVDAAGNHLPFTSRGYRGLESYAVVVLINKGSASASEILAGALRDVRGVKLIGEKSYGKGSVQELVNLSDGSVLKITTAKWVTPNGVSINDEGLKPDVEVEIKEDVEEGKDPQLDKALEILKNL
ncbi:MAG: S41 family peptidase [bacterium]|nr:S41 family peptidase [bacterium]